MAYTSSSTTVKLSKSDAFMTADASISIGVLWLCLQLAQLAWSSARATRVLSDYGEGLNSRNQSGVSPKGLQGMYSDYHKRHTNSELDIRAMRTNTITTWSSRKTTQYSKVALVSPPLPRLREEPFLPAAPELAGGLLAPFFGRGGTPLEKAWP